MTAIYVRISHEEVAKAMQGQADRFWALQAAPVPLALPALTQGELYHCAAHRRARAPLSAHRYGEAKITADQPKIRRIAPYVSPIDVSMQNTSCIMGSLPCEMKTRT